MSLLTDPSPVAPSAVTPSAADSSPVAFSSRAVRTSPPPAAFPALCLETAGLIAGGVTRPVLIVWGLLLILLTLNVLLR